LLLERRVFKFEWRDLIDGRGFIRRVDRWRIVVVERGRRLAPRRQF
jgi:hypothetical protein